MIPGGFDHKATVAAVMILAEALRGIQLAHVLHRVSTTLK